MGNLERGRSGGGRSLLAAVMGAREARGPGRVEDPAVSVLSTGSPLGCGAARRSATAAVSTPVAVVTEGMRAPSSAPAWHRRCGGPRAVLTSPPPNPPHHPGVHRAPAKRAGRRQPDPPPSRSISIWWRWNPERPRPGAEQQLLSCCRLSQPINRPGGEGGGSVIGPPVSRSSSVALNPAV